MKLVVVDASVIVAALLDSGPDGTWAEGVLDDGVLAAPHFMLVEAGNILRRASLAGHVTDQMASLAHGDLLDLQVELFAYEPFAHRIWELRSDVTTYDAWYVALAEHLEVQLATLDRKLSKAAGPRCRFLLPP